MYPAFPFCSLPAGRFVHFPRAVFSSGDFQDALTRADNIKKLSEYDRKMLEEYVLVCEEIENKVYPGFIREKIWELQKQKFGSKNYILRIASMKSIEYLKKYYKKNELIDEIIPQIVEMAKKDKIPNVKFSACEVLASLVNYLGKEPKIKKLVEDYISSLKNDKDEDVVFFSKKAIQDLKN